MKLRTLAPFLLIIALAVGIGIYVYQKSAPGKETLMAAAITYLEEQKAAPDDTETIPMDVDTQTGRVIGVHADGPQMVDRVISFITKAAEVRRVKTIPELTYPHVCIGDRLMGNNEKLYFSDAGKIVEFSLSEADSLGFLLYLSGSGEMYQEVKDTITEDIITQLKNEIAFGNKDVVLFNNGCPEAIDIKTEETAEVLFQCIRNCVNIIDLTDANLEPMALPVEINGRGTGTFESLFTTYQKTGQLICISFSAEDSESFYNYVMALK